MKAVFESGKNDVLSFKLEISIKELESGSVDVLGACKNSLRQAKRERDRQVDKIIAEKSVAEKPAPFVVKDYLGVKLDGKASNMTDEALIDALMDKIAAKNTFDMPEEAIESEYQAMVLGRAQELKYQFMAGGGMDGYREFCASSEHKDIREQVIREYKREQIIKSVIEQENIEASMEELETEAARMAERNGYSMDMVRMFFGNDLALLRSDVLKRKAERLILENAVP